MQVLEYETELVRIAGFNDGPAIAEHLKNLMHRAVQNAQEEKDPDGAATSGFARAAIEYLVAKEGDLDLSTLLATVQATTRILFRTTAARRQLIAGVDYFQFLAFLANRIALPVLQNVILAQGRTICYLASQIYPIGGHTRVIEDLIRLAPSYRHVLIVTNPEDWETVRVESAIRRGTHCELCVLEGTDTIAKVREGARILAANAPSTVVAVGHPDDPIVPILLSMTPAGKKLHVHHADHMFSLVPSSKDIPVVVLFRGAEGALRSAGIDNLVYLPVTCTDPRLIAAVDQGGPVPRSGAHVFTTTTSGSSNKFDPRAGADYLDLMEMRYRARGGRHVHFGPLMPDTLAHIDLLLSRMRRHGDFVHVPFVPYLSHALATLQPDLYIGSYPMGGKRASVEAMAAACPIAAWQTEGYHSAAEIIYPEHLRWNNLSELAAIITGFSEQTGKLHQEYSRDYFEQNHSEAFLRDGLYSLLEAV
jgi:hypothetical protein